MCKSCAVSHTTNPKPPRNPKERKLRAESSILNPQTGETQTSYEKNSQNNLPKCLDSKYPPSHTQPGFLHYCCCPYLAMGIVAQVTHQDGLQVCARLAQALRKVQTLREVVQSVHSSSTIWRLDSLFRQAVISWNVTLLCTFNTIGLAKHTIGALAYQTSVLVGAGTEATVTRKGGSGCAPQNAFKLFLHCFRHHTI